MKYSSVLGFLSVLACTTGQLLIPDGNLVRHVVDAGFATFDVDPTDGYITRHECDVALVKYDTNGDGCVSEPEFEHENALPIPHVVAIFYEHFDKDHQGCLNITTLSMMDEWHKLDTSGDDKASLQEFETYVISIATSILVDMFPLGAITG